jgi:hypothetical protein
LIEGVRRCENIIGSNIGASIVAHVNASTPDLMPADITGTNVFNLQKNEFTLVKGPVFTTFAGR